MYIAKLSPSFVLKVFFPFPFSFYYFCSNNAYNHILSLHVCSLTPLFSSSRSNIRVEISGESVDQKSGWENCCQLRNQWQQRRNLKIIYCFCRRNSLSHTRFFWFRKLESFPSPLYLLLWICIPLCRNSYIPVYKTYGSIVFGVK